MNRDEFNGSIRAAHAFFSGENLVENTVYLVCLPKLEHFNNISMTSKEYNLIYEAGLSWSHYNFSLKDLAFFQFSYVSSSEWALAYYPNPRVSGSPDAIADFNEFKDAAEKGDIDDEEFAALASSLPIGNYIPRIRFEYSESQYRRVRHPGAHFHIGMSGEDRWASSRKLSPLSFVLLIAKLYYPDFWWERSRFSKSEQDQSLQHHIDACLDEKLLTSIRSDGASLVFSDFEKLTFHFGALLPNHP
ncbi:DUF2290 domain-containing protein [Agrobacterium pusense]|uniref:DUF2290 domain-containing protein n=1 Tax=Agrobacterium pusense TaxID=648995 RepID=UPI00156B5CEF|nr:DUF2290 domain-containing protein [Agrobacterium pusense]QKJ91621.1 DUF2290 domain-containing protein [Agrobacterium pusense]